MTQASARPPYQDPSSPLHAYNAYFLKETMAMRTYLLTQLSYYKCYRSVFTFLVQSYHRELFPMLYFPCAISFYIYM